MAHTHNGRTRNGRDPYFPYSLPAARFKVILEDWLEKNGTVDETNPGVKGLYKLEFLTGIPARRIYSILRDESTTMEFNTADRILCGLGLVQLWHVAPEDGGFADWYEANEENPLPDLPAPTEKQLELRRIQNERRRAREAKRLEEFAVA